MKEIKLGEVLDVKRGTSLSGKFYENSGTYIRLTLGNFTYPECGWKDNTSKDDLYYSGDFKNEYLLKKDDIITPLTEQVRGLLGNTARIPESDLYIQSGDIGKIIPFEKLLDKNFAYYLVSSPIVKKQLDAASQQTKIRHTSPDAIKNCIAFIPELASQKKIANLLDSLNKKISTNNCIISELESLAKTIYDYWFLQFEFPNEDGKPYKSSGGKMVWNEELKREIPEGWTVKTLNQVAKRVNVGFVGSIDKHYCDEKDGVQIIRPAEMSKYGINFSALKHVTSEFHNKNKKSQLHFGDVLISRCGKDGIPNIYDSNDEGQVLNAVIIEPDNDKASSSFIVECLKSDYSQIQIKNSTSGSVQGVINTEKISQIKLPYSKYICKRFTGISDVLYEYISIVRKENYKLKDTRDFLLPMLMNGQVTFKE